jgi:hypothetical protein
MLESRLRLVAPTLERQVSTLSEYQYYEFRAVDRPLVKDDLATLRALSSRATITPTQFVNVYNFGNFRGNPAALMETYFDIFVYIANWGTHQLMLRLPRHLLDPAVAMRYCMEEGAELREAGDFVILEYRSDDEGGGWVDDDEGQEWMTALLPVRAALAAGDLRPLYLGWLSCIQHHEVNVETDGYEGMDDFEEIDRDTVEPPVPPGLRTLPEGLQAMVHFLRVDEDLIAVAARNSADVHVAGPSREVLERWIGSLAESEKDTLLLRLVADGDATLQAELVQRFRRATEPDQASAADRRTVGQLLAAAKQRAEERQRREAEHAAREHARKQREAAAARAQRLDQLAGQEPALWHQVDALISAKRPTDYDRAITVLKDLRDLATRSGETAAFAAHLDELRAEHARKPTLMQRLDRAKLGSP